MKPKLSVVMAVYNGQRTLRQAVDSILAQTLRDFEFIVVDDFSHDGTEEILRSYRDPRLLAVRNAANLGQTRSLNVGCRLARGELIARMDADDYSFPERLARQWEYMRRNHEVAALGTGGVVWDCDGREVEPVTPCLNDTEIYTKIFSETVMIHVSAVIRADAMAELGYYNESYLTAQDYDLWSRMLRLRKRIRNLPDPLVAYRADPRSYGRSRSRTTLPEELIRIMLANIVALTNLTVEVEQARGLVDVFATGGMSLSEEEFHDALGLYSSIFNNLRPEIRRLIADDRLARSTLSDCLARRAVVLLRRGHVRALYHHLAFGSSPGQYRVPYRSQSIRVLSRTLARHAARMARAWTA
ncbi:MAG: glycosyltransferase [Deltaproteobacteria bacterium]|nr:glycosyltransferase [Deltaproteobacteria bacterium]